MSNTCGDCVCQYICDKPSSHDACPSFKQHIRCYTTDANNNIVVNNDFTYVAPVDNTNIMRNGKEYVVDWNKFIKDYCTEV